MGPRVQEDNRFFRLLWRFNAVLLAITGVVALLVLVAGILTVGIFPLGGRDAAIPVKDTPEETTHLEFDASGEPLAGTPITLFKLQKVRDRHARGYGSGGSSYNPTQDTNYLLVDGGSATGNWLFPHETQAIWEHTTLYRNPSATGGDMATALVMNVADADTDKDGALTASDRVALFYHRLGAGPAVKFFAADGISGVQQIDPARFVVYFNDHGKWGVATFSTADFSVLRENALPPAPK